MELLDIYDENQNFIGTKSRKEVHENALWHKTIHCWLYDNTGNIYFQIRKDVEKFYTTASGHVLAGETVKQAFGREIREEIGIDIEYEKACSIEVVKFVMDKTKKDGSIFRDRAFSNVFGYELNGDNSFAFDTEEVLGLVKVNAKEALELFDKEQGKVKAEIIDAENNIVKREVDISEFLVNAGETATGKYGNVLKFVINKTM